MRPCLLVWLSTYNFDLVNWIINQDYVGKPAGAARHYTYGDVQRAIWELIEENDGFSQSPWPMLPDTCHRLRQTPLQSGGLHTNMRRLYCGGPPTG